MWLSDFFRRHGATCATGAAILYLTLGRMPDVSHDIPLFEGTDKIVHALMMAGLTAAAVFDRCRAALSTGRRDIAIISLWVMAFGVFTEMAQEAFTASRCADPADALADWCGTLAAAAGIAAILKRIEKRRGCRRP